MFQSTQKTAIFFSCFILVIGLMGMDFINPSLPYIMKALNASQAQTKLLMVWYMFGVGLSQFFYGTFSDNHGRRKAIFLAYAISLFGIVIAIFANSIEVLDISRFIAGVGAGGAPIVARAIIADVCQDEISIKKAFSYFSMSSQLSPALAPVVGGFIQEYLNWRFCFAGLFLTVFISNWILFFYFKETHGIPTFKKSLSHQIKIYASLFSDKRLSLLNLISAFLFVYTIGYYAYMPFILHQVGFSPSENGLLYIFYAASIVLGSLSMRYISMRYPSEKILSVNIVFFVLISLFFYAYFSFYYSLTAIIIVSVLIAFNGGMSAPLVLSLCMQGFTENKGAASAVQSFFRMFFTAVALLCFNTIPLKSMASLMICYIGLSFLIMLLFLYFKRHKKRG